MNTTDLQQIGSGFSNLTLGSQAVFRTALAVLSQPGRIEALASDAHTPAQCDPAATALLLALLDADSRVWLSPAFIGTAAASTLRFHTGCTLVTDPAEADFAWVASPAEWPALGAFAQGTENDPDRSTTCVVQVASLTQQLGWTLSGPGIASTAALQVGGLNAGFVRQWADNHASFPCGVDVFFCAQDRIAGLPRTTRIGV